MNDHHRIVPQREHVLDAAPSACWCEPENLVVCPVCAGDDPLATQHFGRIDEVAPCDPDCWKCGGRGLVPCDDCDAGVACERAHVIVHKG